MRPRRRQEEVPRRLKSSALCDLSTAVLGMHILPLRHWVACSRAQGEKRQGEEEGERGHPRDDGSGQAAEHRGGCHKDTRGGRDAEEHPPQAASWQLREGEARHAGQGWRRELEGRQGGVRQVAASKCGGGPRGGDARPVSKEHEGAGGQAGVLGGREGKRGGGPGGSSGGAGTGLGHERACSADSPLSRRNEKTHNFSGIPPSRCSSQRCASPTSTRQ